MWRFEADRSESLSCSTRGRVGMWGEDETGWGPASCCAEKARAGFWSASHDRNSKEEPMEAGPLVLVRHNKFDGRTEVRVHLIRNEAARANTGAS